MKTFLLQNPAQRRDSFTEEGHVANCYATARTNYFGVKDPETFTEEMKGYLVDVIKKDNKFGLVSTNSEGFEDYYCFEEEYCVMFDSGDIEDLYTHDYTEAMIYFMKHKGSKGFHQFVKKTWVVHLDGEPEEISVEDMTKKMLTPSRNSSESGYITAFINSMAEGEDGLDFVVQLTDSNSGEMYFEYYATEEEAQNRVDEVNEMEAADWFELSGVHRPQYADDPEDEYYVFAK